MNPGFTEQLEDYFTKAVPLPEFIDHLDKLLYYLFYYYSAEGMNDFSIIFDDVYRFKRVLQNFEIVNEKLQEKNGNQ